MKILIAEDDRTSYLMLDAILKKWGYDVVLARYCDCRLEDARDERSRVLPEGPGNLPPLPQPTLFC